MNTMNCISWKIGHNFRKQIVPKLEITRIFFSLNQLTLIYKKSEWFNCSWKSDFGTFFWCFLWPTIKDILLLRNQGQEKLREFVVESWIRKGIFKLSIFYISLTGVTSSSVFLSFLWHGDFDSIFSTVYLVRRLPFYWSGKVLRI